MPLEAAITRSVWCLCMPREAAITRSVWCLCMPREAAITRFPAHAWIVLPRPRTQAKLGCSRHRRRLPIHYGAAWGGAVWSRLWHRVQPYWPAGGATARRCRGRAGADAGLLAAGGLGWQGQGFRVHGVEAGLAPMPGCWLLEAWGVEG